MKNPSAFPRHMTIYGQNTKAQSEGYGMTLRDYFAAKAMQGFAACDDDFPSAESVAINAYKWADAMLKAREA